MQFNHNSNSGNTSKEKKLVFEPEGIGGIFKMAKQISSKKSKLLIVVTGIVVLAAVGLIIFTALGPKRKETAANKDFEEYISNILRHEQLDTAALDAQGLSDIAKENKAYSDINNKIKDKIKVEVKEKKVDGDSATFKVEVTSIDFKAIIPSLYEKLITVSSSESIDDTMLKSMMEMLDKGQGTTTKSTIIIRLRMDKENWVIENPQELNDAMYPGMKEAYAELSKEYYDILKSSILK